MLKKIISNSDRFCKTFKYIFYTVWIVIIYALSYSMVTYWKPYIMHCETKLDRTDAVPQWCFEDMPNIFSYIQRVYWYGLCAHPFYRDNRILGFLHRSPDHVLIASPMIIFTCYVVYKFFSANFFNYLTFGIFSIKEGNITKERVENECIYVNPALVPFVWNFISNMLLIILFANIDVSCSWLITGRSYREWQALTSCTTGSLHS